LEKEKKFENKNQHVFTNFLGKLTREVRFLIASIKKGASKSGNVCEKKGKREAKKRTDARKKSVELLFKSPRKKTGGNITSECC